MVRWAGVEPARLSAHGPQPCLSASSSTSAFIRGLLYNSLGINVKPKLAYLT